MFPTDVPTTSSVNFYLKRKIEGRCVECGELLPADYDKVRCPECLLIRNQKQKKDVEKLKELNICIVCRKQYAEPFKIMCYECSLKSREAHQKWLETQDIEELKKKKRIKSKETYRLRKEQGICTRCGKHKAMPMHCMCERCNLKHAEYKRLKGKTNYQKNAE